MQIGGDQALDTSLLRPRPKSKTEQYLHSEVQYGVVKIETISFVSFLLLLLNNWPGGGDPTDRFYDYHTECLDTLKSIWFVVSLFFVFLDIVFLVPLVLGYLGIIPSPGQIKLPPRIRAILGHGGWNTYSFFDMVLTDLPIAILSTILFLIGWYCSSTQYYYNNNNQSEPEKMSVSSDYGERLLVIVINLLAASKIVKAIVDWKRGKSPEEIVFQALADEEGEYEESAELGRSSAMSSTTHGSRRWEKQPQTGRTLAGLASGTR